MKSKRIERLFYALADLAVGKGMEFSLELRDCESQSKVLNGAFGNSSTRDNGLTLRAWWPESSDQIGGAAEMVDEDEAEAGDGDD